MKIAVVGAGKMGGWLARELARAHDVWVYDTAAGRAEAVEGATVLGAVEELTACEPELLVNAVPLEATVEAFAAVAPLIPATCMLCDLASIKAQVAQYYAGAGFRFVSVHPMFGPTFASMDALREENAIIIRESDPQGAGLFLRLFASLGVRTFEASFEQHDALMAYSLATPFVASLVFAACLQPGTVPGSTFARHRRIARGLLSEDDRLIAEILFQPGALDQIDRITDRLEFLKHIIRGRDSDEMKLFLDRLRDNLSSSS